jgi:hypothetical protein
VARCVEGVAIQCLEVSTKALDEIAVEGFVCELPVVFSFVFFDGLSFGASDDLNKLHSPRFSRSRFLGIASDMLVGAVPGILYCC